MFLIIGLGNPGLKYAKTRHNVGFMAIEAIAQEKKVMCWKQECHAHTASYYEDGEKVMLVKPQTYMNLSGIAVRELSEYYKVPSEQIIIIYDDIDLELGQVRIRQKGGPGTHNGMRSIVENLGSGDFPRIRLGIGPKREKWDLADFVLARLDLDEEQLVESMCDKVTTAVTLAVTKGIDIAMNRLNRKTKKKKAASKEVESIEENNELCRKN